MTKAQWKNSAVLGAALTLMFAFALVGQMSGHFAPRPVPPLVIIGAQCTPEVPPLPLRPTMAPDGWGLKGKTEARALPKVMRGGE